MSGVSPLLLIITALAASGIQAYPSQCWSDNSAVDCKDDCLNYLDFVNNDPAYAFTVDDLCCTYAERSAVDTTVSYAGCIICSASGGNAYCPASGHSAYNCFTECTTDDCNDPVTLSNASGTCIARVNDDYFGYGNGQTETETAQDQTILIVVICTVVGVVGIVVGIICCCCCQTNKPAANGQNNKPAANGTVHVIQMTPQQVPKRTPM